MITCTCGQVIRFAEYTNYSGETSLAMYHGIIEVSMRMGDQPTHIPTLYVATSLAGKMSYALREVFYSHHCIEYWASGHKVLEKLMQPGVSK